MIRIAIVEDEDLYAGQLSGMLNRFSRDTGTQVRITRFKDGDEIVEGYTGAYDIIFLDIQMQFMNGMEAASRIREHDREVILFFITNRTDYAIRGYEVDALDYIVKPVSYEALKQKLERAIDRMSRRQSHFVMISTKESIMKIPSDKILYIESQGHNLIYHTGIGVFQTREKMKDIESHLSEWGFYRCNKGYLVNLSHVDGIQDGCCLIGGEKLLISRSRKTNFMAALTDFID